MAMASDTNSLSRRRLNMVAGRRTSASDQNDLEEGLNPRPNKLTNGLEEGLRQGRSASILTPQKLSSPSYIEAIRNHSNLLHRRGGSHVDLRVL